MIIMLLFLESVGITNPTEVVHNPSYEQLFIDETAPDLKGFEKGYVTDTGAVNVLTGEYTGRSPKDKFIVKDNTTKDTLSWNENGTNDDNKPS